MGKLLKTLRRQWIVALVGAIATVGAVSFAIQDESVYWTRTNIVFLAPSSERYPNSLQTRSEALVVTAGIVASRINGPGISPKYASTDATLVGIPQRGQAFWLRLPDSGGQWSRHFAEQILLLDVVGDSPEEVAQIEAEVVAHAREELWSLQRAHDVDPRDEISITVAPDPPVIAQISGSRVRAAAMTAALGLAATFAAAVLIDRRSSRGRPTPSTISSNHGSIPAPTPAPKHPL